MKKVIVIISLLLVFVLLGYIWQNSNKQDGNNKISENNRFAGFERPEEKPNISGIVKTITGNEVTILKIERQMSGENNNENSNIEKGESDEEKDDEREQKLVPGSGGGMGMGMGSRSNIETEDTDERLEMLKSMSTGEEKIVIPVGIKILKNEDGEMIEATLNDIIRDKMLVIWTDTDITDKNVANFVIIN